MNGEEQNKRYFKETFQEIPVPERLAENVENRIGRRKKSAGTVMRKVAIAAIAALALFAGSNGIAYAMTGNTWMETMLFQLKGIEYEVDLTEGQTRNGETVYTGIVKEADGDMSHIQINGEDGQVLISTTQSAGLRSVNGRTYIQDEDLEIDVTEQLEKNGYAAGTYEKNGFVKQYAVRKRGDHLKYRVETLYDGMPENDWVTEWLEEDITDDKLYVNELPASPTPVP